MPVKVSIATVTNLDASVRSLANAFTVNAAPTITSLSPNALKHRLSNQTVTVTGSGFESGTWTPSSVTFTGGGITVNSVTYTSATTLTLNISLSSSATGARAVTVTNPDAGWSTLANGFTVT